MARRGFTLIELLVVMAILSILMGILLPGLNKVKYQARRVLGANNQRQIVSGVNLFATDNDDWYPESVATIGDDATWNWQEPMMLTGYRARSPRIHRSMSAYLRRYIKDAGVLYCPNAPWKYKYLQDAWDAGDAWDNPDTPPVEDPVSGTYCFYWSYTGYLQERDYLFQGPRHSIGGRRQSKLLVSDYFAYDHWRSENVYSSCETFGGCSITEGTLLSSPYWSGKTDDLEKPRIKLQAGYMDGHVESYSSLETVEMQVIMEPATGKPYPDQITQGSFYLPCNALR
jgi:prepilin-type N-terminal cleavage/methylation domain-containing protein